MAIAPAGASEQSRRRRTAAAVIDQGASFFIIIRRAVDKPTQIADLDLPAQPPMPTVAKGIVPRVPLPANALPMLIEPQLESTDIPFYAKLRAEELGGGVLARKVRTESAVGRRESREVGPELTRPRTSAVRKFSPGCLAHGSRGDALDKVSRRDRILRGGGNLTGRRHDAPGGHHAARGHVSYGRSSPRLVRSLRRESLEHGAE